MKYNFLFIIFFFATFNMIAQPDSEKKSIKIPAKEIKEKDSTPSNFKISPKEDISLSKKEKTISGIPFKSKVTIKEEEEEFSMFDNSKLINPGTIFENRWNKKAAEQGIRLEAMADQFLGNYLSNGQFVNIRCRDHEYPDGDMVRVFVNGDIIVPQLVLSGGFKSFNVALTPGINEIVFLALNQGDSGPNTAEFEVYDDEGNLVSSKKWNLLTGVKATIIVTKQ